MDEPKIIGYTIDPAFGIYIPGCVEERSDFRLELLERSVALIAGCIGVHHFPARFDGIKVWAVGGKIMQPDSWSLHVIPQEDNPPHYLLLLGLKGDSHAKTVFIKIADILKHLSAETVTALKKPIYELRSGASYSNEATINVRSIIDETAENSVLHYIKDSRRVIPQNEEAAQALAALNQAVETAQKENAIELAIDAGDAVIFNNGALENGVIHARAGRIADMNRWLQRGFLYEEAQSYKEQNGPHLAKLLAQSLSPKSKIPGKIAVETLRQTLSYSDSVRAYIAKNKEANKETTPSQAFLYGLEMKEGNKKESWIQRIAQEAVAAKAL